MASNVRMDNWDNFILSPDTAAWKTAPKQAIDVHFSDELVEFCELETFQIHPEKIEKKPMVLMQILQLLRWWTALQLESVESNMTFENFPMQGVFTIDRTTQIYKSICKDTHMDLEQAIVEQYLTWDHLVWKPLATIDIDFGTVHFDNVFLEEKPSLLKKLKNIFLQMNTVCTCSAGNVLLSVLRSVRLPCCCNSFQTFWELFQLRFDKSPLTLKHVDETEIIHIGHRDEEHMFKSALHEQIFDN